MGFLDDIANTFNPPDPPPPPSTQKMMLINNQTVLAKLLNTAKVRSNQAFSFNVSNTRGDVLIANNSFNQTATLDLKAAFKQVADVETLKDLALAVGQSSKDFVNNKAKIEKSTAAVNHQEMYIDTSSTISSEIDNKCLAESTQTFSVEVKNTGGNVTITDNSFNQVATVMADCFADTINKSELTQKLDATMVQTAPEPPMFSIYIVLSLLGIVLMVTYKKFVPFVVVAIGLLITFYGWSVTLDDVVVNSYSRLIANQCPDATLLSSGPVGSVARASETCLANKECVAFDVISYVLDADNNAVKQQILTANYYSSLPDTCSAVFKEVDELKIIHVPRFGSGPSAPTLSIIDDIWLNTNTSEWFVFDRTVRSWIKKGQFSTAFKVGATTAAWDPGTADIVVKPSGPVNVASFTLTRGGETAKVPGPGYMTQIPDPPNTSGYVTSKTQWGPILGGLLVTAVGMGGVVPVVVGFLKSK